MHLLIEAFAYTECPLLFVAGLFSINSTGGEIWMNGLLDYEVVQQFHLTVEAIDNGIVRRTDKLDIFVYLTDVNDNAPIFQRDYGPYR